MTEMPLRAILRRWDTLGKPVQRAQRVKGESLRLTIVSWRRTESSDVSKEQTFSLSAALKETSAPDLSSSNRNPISQIDRLLHSNHLVTSF